MQIALHPPSELQRQTDPPRQTVKDLLHDPVEPRAAEAAHAIFEVMNARSLRRERLEVERLLGPIMAATGRNVPVHFLLYWGKGDRNAVCGAEQQALELLRTLAERIQSVYPPGARFTAVFTDTHARLNGYAAEGSRDYRRSLESLVRTLGLGMEVIPMSRLVDMDLAALTREAGDVSIEPALFDMLTAMCRKHYLRSDDYALGAKAYYLENQREKEIVGRFFPLHVFLTYNASGLDALLPSALPIYRMWPAKRGVSVKPWFSDDPREDECSG